MPALEITRSTDDLLSFYMNSGQVLGIMLYPSDSVKRERFVGLFEASITGPPHPHQQITWETLWDNYGFSKQQWRSGMIAGHVLKLFRQIEKHDPSCEASVLKAIHILINTRQVLGKSVKRSRVRQAWSDFKSVSHLWVAAENLSDQWASSPKPETDIAQPIFAARAILDSGWCHALISIAEEWRQFGEKFQHRGGLSLLDPDETWAAPKDYDVIQNYPVVPPLGQDEIRHLESYMAPAPY